MEQIAIFDVLRRHMSMIIGLCIVAALAGYGFSFLLTERYVASALVLVRPQEPIKIDSTKSDKQFLDFPVPPTMQVDTAGRTYIEIIKSAALIGKVVSNLGLDKEKETKSSGIFAFLPAYLKTAAENLQEFFGDLTAILKYGSLIRDDPFTRAVKEVKDNLTLESRENTFVFEIKYSAKNPQMAADVSNTTAKLFTHFMEDIRLSEVQYARDHFKDQVDQSKKKLITAREQLQSYKEAHSVFLYESEYNAKLKVISELEVELAKVEGALVGSQGTLSTPGLVAKREHLSRTLREREAELTPLPKIERELKQRELDVQVALTTYEAVDKEFRDADVNQSYPVAEVRSVSQALPPRLPSSPVRFNIALASLIAGMVVGIGVAFFLEFINRRVRGIHDVEDLLGVRVLATIPRVSWRRWRRAGL